MLDPTTKYKYIIKNVNTLNGFCIINRGDLIELDFVLFFDKCRTKSLDYPFITSSARITQVHYSTQGAMHHINTSYNFSFLFYRH